MTKQEPGPSGHLVSVYCHASLPDSWNVWTLWGPLLCFGILHWHVSGGQPCTSQMSPTTGCFDKAWGLGGIMFPDSLSFQITLSTTKTCEGRAANPSPPENPHNCALVDPGLHYSLSMIKSLAHQMLTVCHHQCFNLGHLRGRASSQQYILCMFPIINVSRTTGSCQFFFQKC